MIDIKKIAIGLFCIISVPMFVGCGADFESGEIVDENGPHSCPLVFNISKTGFDDEGDTRSNNTWRNGDKIYLKFDSDSSTTYGEAEYTGSAWNINYYGSLKSNGTVKAVYFDNPAYTAGTIIQLSATTGIYEDVSASYTYNNGKLTVTALLKPKTGRIRFKGSGNDNISLLGITSYTNYEISTGRFSLSTSNEAITTQLSGAATPYLYGELVDADSPRIVLITSESAFTRSLSSSIFRAGESGYMNIPTVNSYSGWQNMALINVNGVEFTMIPIEYDEGNYLMAQTETTNALFKAVTGNSILNSNNFPVMSYYRDYIDFVKKLSDLTNLKFDIPTFSEWYYAATGGKRSKGYTYAGGNILSEVGWYISNSDYRSHEVMQLKPNELGLYDMSGNAAEYVAEGTWVGGNYYSEESGCKLVDNHISTGSSSQCGLRFIMRLGN